MIFPQFQRIHRNYPDFSLLIFHPTILSQTLVYYTLDFEINAIMNEAMTKEDWFSPDLEK